MFITKPLPKPVLINYQLETHKQISVKLSENNDIFNQENAFENVACKIVAILFCPHVLTMYVQ